MLSSITKVIVVPFEVNKDVKKIVNSASNLAVPYYNCDESVWCIEIATNDEKLAASIHAKVQEALFNAQNNENLHHASVSKNKDVNTCVGCCLSRSSCDKTSENDWETVLATTNSTYDIFHLLRFIKDHGVSSDETIRMRVLDMLYYTVDPNNVQEGVFPVHYEDLCRYATRFAKAYPMSMIIDIAKRSRIDGRDFKNTLNSAVKDNLLTEEQAKIVRYAYS